MVSTENRIRKVLMTTDTIGGVWTYCIELINEMASRKIHFHLVSAGRALSDDQRQQVKRLPNVTIHETEFKLEWMNDAWKDIDFSGWHLLELERRLKPDVVHLNSFSYAALPFKSPVIVVAHSDVFSWWFSVKKSIPGKEWQEYFRRVKEGIRGADCVVAPSDSMLGMLAAIYGNPPDYRVIYNGRNAADFRCEEKVPRLMCAGRFWDDAKNLKLLGRAAEHIHAEILVAGDLSAEQQCPRPGNMRFLGRLNCDEMAAHLSTTLIYVAPAKYEPFGLSILEAALSGCALVLGNIPSLKELWGDSAIYVDVDDEHALATTCNRLLENKELAEVYASKARKRAANFSLRRMSSRYAALYSELVKKKHQKVTMQTA